MEEGMRKRRETRWKATFFPGVGKLIDANLHPPRHMKARSTLDISACGGWPLVSMSAPQQPPLGRRKFCADQHLWLSCNQNATLLWLPVRSIAHMLSPGELYCTVPLALSYWD
jgi:hypothetical protein